MIGAIMMDVSGWVLTDTEKTRLAKPSIGGVILFARNYKNINQIKALVASIRKINPDLLLAVDHEGGRVQRFKQGFTHLPAMAELGKAYAKNPEKACKQAFSCGWILAAELLAIGMDFSFAPVLDLDYGNSKVIGDRSFAAKPSVVVELATALVTGMHEAGMKCVGKHFPGHGYVATDSHFDLPVDNRPMAQIEYDMCCFKDLIAKGLLDAVMSAHILYPQVDKKPVGFSKKWVDILRQDLGFQGVIFSDDLSMQGACFIRDITQRVQATLDNGHDMVLICNHPELLNQVIDNNWRGSEKLHLMRGIKNQKFDKMTHLKIIEDLL